MKVGKTYIAVLAVLQVAAGNIFQDWTSTDIKQYLKDQGEAAKSHINYDLEELKSYANERWSEDSQPKPWWKVWPYGKKDNWWDVTGTGSGSKSISDWIFETWSAKDLRKLLRHSGITFDSDLSHEKLKMLARSKFEEISKKLDTSGYYPTELYFNDWDEYDLKAWLTKNGVSYEHVKASKEKLADLVRKNIYKASKVYQEEKYHLLESLDFSQRKFFEAGNKLKKNLFDLWSSEDIVGWLEYHRVKLTDETKQNRDNLIALANENLDILEEDIKWFTDEARKNSTPIISKDVEAVKSIWGSVKEKFAKIYRDENIINDTFLIGVKSWPKKRLQAFLDARGVKYHILSTRDELLQLVHENRNKPLKSWEGAFDAAKNWWNKQTVINKVKSASADILGRVSTLESDMLEQLQISFDSWSNKDLTTYLKSFTSKPADLKGLSRDDLIKKAKENTMWFFGTPKKPWYSQVAERARTLAHNAYAYVRP